MLLLAPSAPEVASAEAAPSAAAGEQLLQHLTRFLLRCPPLAVLPLRQTQVSQKNVSALLPPQSHVAGLKNRGIKGVRKTNTMFWAVFL